MKKAPPRSNISCGTTGNQSIVAMFKKQAQHQSVCQAKNTSVEQRVVENSNSCLISNEKDICQGQSKYFSKNTADTIGSESSNCSYQGSSGGTKRLRLSLNRRSKHTDILIANNANTTGSDDFGENACDSDVNLMIGEKIIQPGGVNETSGLPSADMTKDKAPGEMDISTVCDSVGVPSQQGHTAVDLSNTVVDMVSEPKSEDSNSVGEPFGHVSSNIYKDDCVTEDVCKSEGEDRLYQTGLSRAPPHIDSPSASETSKQTSEERNPPAVDDPENSHRLETVRLAVTEPDGQSGTDPEFQEYRVPYYLQNFLFILKEVLEDPFYKELFDVGDMDKVNAFQQLSGILFATKDN